MAPVKSAPTAEQSVAVVTALPSWGALGGMAKGTPNDREYLDAFRWPTSVRETVPRMETDTQLSGLMRGTALPIRRYVWGVDPNGAPPKMVAAAMRDFNLPLIDDAWQAFQSGQTTPVGRSKHRFSFDKHIADALKAPGFGHYYFEQVGEIAEDGVAWGAAQAEFWHPVKLAPIAPWSIGQIFAAKNGDLISIRQSIGLQSPELPASTLVPYVFDQDAGDWIGKSMFRSCYREWLAKDLLIRIDLENHRKAGGVLITEAPEGATPTEREALGQMASAFAAGGGGSVPAGTNPVFIRATGSDVIASINRHDEAMAREFLMMFMALGTSSSGGNRALAGSFIDWFAISQESIAIWFRDTFNEHVLEDWVDWNYGVGAEYVPRLVFRRPEAASPLDALASAVTANPGDPAAVAVTSADGATTPVSASRVGGVPGAVVVTDEMREQILAAHADFQRQNGVRGPWRPPRAASAASVSLPDRPLRRDPTDVEVRAQVDFAQLDSQWQAQVDSIVAQWTAIRSDQIDELVTAIENAGGDMSVLAQIRATVAGGDMIAAQLKTMAALGAGQAAAEAAKQGVAATVPDLAAIETQLESRAAALEQLLTSALSQAAANKAVQLTGGGLTPADVAGQVRDYLAALSDAYLNDQFGGAMSAAQNAGRLEAMDTNGATAMYASELLDANTCEPCAEVDGTEYATAEEAAADYPGGGYFDCEGGPRCRGTVVAVYDEASPSSEGGA